MLLLTTLSPGRVRWLNSRDCAVPRSITPDNV